MQVLQPIIHLVLASFFFLFFFFFFSFFLFNRFSFSFVHTVLPSHTSTVTNQTLYRNQHLGHKRCWNVAVWGYIYIPHRVSMKQVLWRHWRTKVNARKCHWSWSYDIPGEQKWIPEENKGGTTTIYSTCISFSISLQTLLLLECVSKCSRLCSDCRGKQLPPECVS